MLKLLHQYFLPNIGEDEWLIALEHFGDVLFIFVLSYFVLKLTKVSLRRYFKSRDRQRGGLGARSKTFHRMLESLLRYAVVTGAVLALLREFNVPTTSLLAGAGVLTVALGFGAQSLIKDIIAGISIIFENQLAVGDVVKINNIEGEVEEVGFRYTQIRMWSGELYTLPNGSIDEVINYSRGHVRAEINVEISLQEDAKRVLEIITRTIKGVAETADEPFSTEPEVQGIVNADSVSMTIRVVVFVPVEDKWTTERKMRLAIKQALDAEKILYPGFAMPPMSAKIWTE